MIAIDLARCTGCGRCVDVCPAGALRLEQGRAVVDHALCRECEACLSACPHGAITLITAPVTVVESRLPQPRPAGTTEALPRAAAPAPHQGRILPALAAVASFTGREILPRVLEVLATAPSKSEVGSARSSLKGSQATEETAGPPGQRSRQRRRKRYGKH